MYYILDSLTLYKEFCPALYHFWVFCICATLSGGANCALYRWYKKENWITGRSHCEICGQQLSFLEVLPVISCIALKGRCFHCGAYIGYKHAITEATVGFLGALIFSSFTDGYHWALKASVFCVVLFYGAYILNLDVKKGM